MWGRDAEFTERSRGGSQRRRLLFRLWMTLFKRRQRFIATYQVSWYLRLSL